MDVFRYCEKMKLQKPGIITLDGYLYDHVNKYYLIHKDEYDDFCDYQQAMLLESITDDIQGEIGEDASDILDELTISYIKYIIEKEGVWVSYQGEGYLYVKI